MINLEDIKIRLAKRDDAFEVNDLLSSLGLIMPEGKDKINKHWERQLINNPFYKYFPGDPFFGWVMQNNNKIVGFFGSIPRLYYIKGKLTPAAIASQWGVLKEFRQFTYLLCEKFFNDHPIAFKVVSTAIKPTGKIFEKYGGKKVPAEKIMDVYMIPLNLQKLIAHKFKGASKKNTVLKLGISFLKIFPWKYQYRLIKKDTLLQEVDVNNMPKEYEIFWQEYLKKSDTIISSRSKDVLKWFYKGDFRDIKKNVFVYWSKNKTNIIGYAAVMEEPIKDGTLIRFKIVDILAETTEVKKKIIKALIRLCYDMNADVLEIHLPNKYDKKDIPHFTLTRQIPQWPFYYQNTNAELNDVLEIPGNWFVSSFDGDTCLG